MGVKRAKEYVAPEKPAKAMLPLNTTDDEKVDQSYSNLLSHMFRENENQLTSKSCRREKLVQWTSI